MSEVSLNTGVNPSITEDPQYVQKSSGASNHGDEVAITSVELMFAKLQNDLAIENREYAKDRIDAIKQKQQESKEISNVIVALRTACGNLKDTDNIDKSKIEDFNKVIDMCNKYGIKVDVPQSYTHAIECLQKSIDDAHGGNIRVANIPDISDVRKAIADSGANYNTKHYPNYTNISTRDLLGVKSIGWRDVSTADVQEVLDNFKKAGPITVGTAKNIIESLQNIQETIGSDTQQQMIFVQDFMSKVSSYSQGAISAISKSGDTLTSVARG
jgi:hypothetical protein